MKHFTSTAAATFAPSRVSEGAAEIAMAGAAALFTAAIWLSIGTWAFSPEQRLEVAMAHQARAVTHVTLPTVVIVGRRDSLDGTPVMTTAQNTSAIPVTLKQ
ncbi:MAG: hypothetical protein ACAH21_10340 [Ramlibacter sp.]